MPCRLSVLRRGLLYLADDRVNFLSHDPDLHGLLHRCADDNSQKVLTHRVLVGVCVLTTSLVVLLETYP